MNDDSDAVQFNFLEFDQNIASCYKYISELLITLDSASLHKLDEEASNLFNVFIFPSKISFPKINFNIKYSEIKDYLKTYPKREPKATQAE